MFLGFYRSVFYPNISLKNYLKELFMKLSSGKNKCVTVTVLTTSNVTGTSVC